MIYVFIFIFGIEKFKFRNILFPEWKLGYNGRLLWPTYVFGDILF